MKHEKRDGEMTGLERAACAYLMERLALCTTQQQERFHKMYPDGLYGLTWERLRNAEAQVERTLKKNVKK